MTARDIVSRSPSYEQRPRLSRPGLRLVPEPLRAGPRVIMRPAAASPRLQARRKIIVFYGAMAVLLLIGKLFEARQAVATAQPAVLTVGEHTFTEIAPEQSALVTAPGEQRT